jgi:hypothetical protein
MTRQDTTTLRLLGKGWSLPRPARSMVGANEVLSRYRESKPVDHDHPGN